ncbi:3328_t:CDS:2, partial [Diversispora eburnea]
MVSKKTNKDPDSQPLEKPTKSRPPLARLVKDDIIAILYTKELKDTNLPDWYPNNIKIEKAGISSELMSQEIITPEEPVIIKPDPIE